MQEREYIAFLSYSHRDKRWANWLHRAIESYAVPFHLVGSSSPIGSIPRHLKPIFRDRDELSASASLGENIETALRQSRCLIILCSPDAATSRWTNEEIATFKRLHPDRPILAAVVGGEPFASEMEGRAVEEAFPPALRFQLTADGTLTKERAEPIAADFRANGDGKRLGKLKLVAGMLGLPLDELVRRDAARRNRRLAWLAAASFAGMAFMAGLTVFAFQQRQQAIYQREQADDLIEFMLTDLRKKLEPVGRLDALDSVGERALAYYGEQDVDSLDADALGRRSRALLLVGEVADLRGKAPAALESFRQSARTTGELLERDPDNWQRVYDHAQSNFWIGYMEGEQGDYAARLRYLKEYDRLSQRLVALRPADSVSQLEALYGRFNLGTVYRDLGRSSEALAAFDQTLAQAGQIKNPTSDVLMTISESYAHMATLQARNGNDAASIPFRLKQIASLENPALDQSDKSVLESKAFGNSNLARAQFSLGRYSESNRSAARSMALWKRLVTLDPENRTWAEGMANTRLVLAENALATGNVREAREQTAMAMAPLRLSYLEQPNDLIAAIDYTEALTLAMRSGMPGTDPVLRDVVDKTIARHPRLSVQASSALAMALAALADGAVDSDGAEATSRRRQAYALLAPFDQLPSLAREKREELRRVLAASS